MLGQFDIPREELDKLMDVSLNFTKKFLDTDIVIRLRPPQDDDIIIACESASVRATIYSYLQPVPSTYIVEVLEEQ